MTATTCPFLGRLPRFWGLLRTYSGKFQHDALEIGLLDRRETFCRFGKNWSSLTRRSVDVERERQEKNDLRTMNAHLMVNKLNL